MSLHVATNKFNGVITIKKSWVARFNDNDNKDSSYNKRNNLIVVLGQMAKVDWK